MRLALAATVFVAHVTHVGAAPQLPEDVGGGVPQPATEPSGPPGTPIAAAPAHEAWYVGPRGRTRVLHLGIAAGFGAGFLIRDGLAMGALAPDSCRWCDPPSLDRRVRDALVWDDFDQARSLSNLTGYVALPVFGVGIVGAMALSADDSGWARLIDDVVPVLETVAISQVITQAAKFSVGRARPLVRFRDVTDPDDQDNNLSFYSGHSALTFGITVSAGMIARWRGSRLEPVIWGVGLPLSAATAYLRIAADKHYFTDVLTGTAVGIAAGLIIPRWMRHRDERLGGLAIVPTGSGLSLTGSF